MFHHELELALSKPGQHLAAEHGVARREWRSRLDSYIIQEGWVDLEGTPVGLCQTCSACVARADLKVSGGLVVWRACAEHR